MPATLSPDAPQVLRDYDEVLEVGAAAYGEGEAMRRLVSDHLDFTGALAGHRPDATEGFLCGAAGFVATVQGIEVLQEVHDDTGSAVLYTATMPGGPMTFAEFLTFDDGRIASLQLHDNGPEYLEKGGR